MSERSVYCDIDSYEIMVAVGAFWTVPC